MADKSTLPTSARRSPAGSPTPPEASPAPRRAASTLPGLSSTASSLRAARAQGQGAKSSRLGQQAWTPDEDGFEEGPGDTQRQIDELRGGIVMPGMGARGAPAAQQAGQPASTSSTSALDLAGKQRIPTALKSALKKPAPLLRRATAGPSTAQQAVAGDKSIAGGTQATRPSAAAQNRFKGTPPRAIRYSLPVRAEKPVRTTKMSGKHVVLPSESQLAPLPGEDDDEDDEEEDEEESSSSEDETAAVDADDEELAQARDQEGPLDEEEVERQRLLRKERREEAQRAAELRRERRAAERDEKLKKSRAPAPGPAHARAPPRVPKASGPAYHTFERLAPAARLRTPLPRLKSYAIGTDLHIPTLNGFLRREHSVRPRLYDECAYVVYFKPLLPGFGRANIRSSPEPRGASPGSESRRERELEEREERGYVGSYFAPNKDDNEEALDPEGYIQGGEGSGSGETEERRNRPASRATSPSRDRYNGETTEAEEDTETEREKDLIRSSSPEDEGRMMQSSSDAYELATIDNAATPRALQPRTERDDDDALVELDLNSSADAATASSPMDSSSDQPLSPRPDEEALPDDTSLADRAGAIDMMRYQQEDEAAGRGLEAPPELENLEVAAVIDAQLQREDDSRKSRFDSSNDNQPSSGTASRSSRGRRPRKSRSGPNQASHNHDNSVNMLALAPIREALQVAELVILPYGVVVFYNFTASEERDIIDDIMSSGCVRGALGPDDVETEAFHFCYDPTVPAPRIFNDFFTFRAPNHLLKLSLAHAIAQSTKLSVFEESMQKTLELTSHIPKELASSGELKLKRREALRLTGRLFKLRVDVNLTSNVLDTPELFWSEATLQALYDAIREYLEIDQRVANLNDRLKVANDLLEIIHGHVAEEAMSKITVVIIALIVVACIVAIGEIAARVFMAQRRGVVTATAEAAGRWMTTTNTGSGRVLGQMAMGSGGDF